MISSESQSAIAPSVDLTPLLDLIFIVMVFLLLTTNVQIEAMKINVPQTSDTQVLSEVDKPVININLLDGDKSWGIDGHGYDNWNRFTTALLAAVKAHPEKALIVGADKGAKVESMLKLLAFMQAHNIQTTDIIMEGSSL